MKLSKTPQGIFSKLSPREWQLVGLMNQGLKTTELALKLKVKSNTVSTMKKNIYDKLGITNDFALIVLSIQEGILKL